MGNNIVNLSGEIVKNKKTKQNVTSEFRGTYGGYFGILIGTGLLSLIPFCLPLAIVIRHRWVAKNTVIVGMPLRFEGKAGELLGKFFVWGFFSVITLFIYFFIAVPVKYKRWVTENTIFDPSVV
ncbi:MAG: DUF898 domain-containing protein [Clostridia bacterium]|nr:DUF898 domain-containing protein [Clostridia bacterium]